MSQLPRPDGHSPSRPRSDRPGDLGFTPRPRVRWLAPGMLARTGVQVALSEVFGSFADRRETQATESAAPLDLTSAGDDAHGGEFWLDYVADIGDGFDGATTVASRLAADELELAHDGQSHPTRGGRLLVLGGDECYPVASGANYTDRLVGPYRSMLPWSDQPRWLVALTRQPRLVRRAHQLPAPQLDYFRRIAEQVGEDEAGQQKITAGGGARTCIRRTGCQRR
ncbi:MAG TPA: hypothetical protein VGH99_10130 [Pseudonocardia sp.]